jgi:hypothetical protein
MMKRTPALGEIVHVVCPRTEVSPADCTVRRSYVLEVRRYLAGDYPTVALVTAGDCVEFWPAERVFDTREAAEAALKGATP